MTSKSVILSNGMTFSEIGIAQQFFKKILHAETVGVDVNGVDFSLLEALYRDYCAATSWPLSARICAFTRGIESQIRAGKKIKTKCFFAKFSDGSEQSFSYLKACSKIANAVKS